MTFRRADAAVAGGTVVLFLASFLVYWPAVHGDFIWDDSLNITGNPIIRSDDGLVDIWAGGEQIFDYYPLTWTTWWIEWRLWHRETLGYHVLNIVLHAGAAALLWRVLARLRVPGAFVAALVFAVHPVNVETVAWISERKNTLSMFLLATTLALFLDSQDAVRSTGRRRALYFASVLVFCLTLLAKPAVVLFPIVLLALAWWKRGGRVWWSDVGRSIPFFAVSAAVSAITVFVHHSRSIVASTVRTDDFSGRLATAGWAVWFYLSKLFWPANLAFIYPRWHVDPNVPLHWIPLGALLALAIALHLLRDQIGRGWLVALAGYVAFLLPVLGFVDIYFMRYSLVADHWQYQAGFVATAAVVAAGTCALRWFDPHRGIRQVAGTLIAGLVCLVLAGRAWQEAHLFRSGLDLWAEAIRDNPHASVAYSNYAGEMMGRGRVEEARQNYIRSIQLDPDASEGYIGVGMSYMPKEPAAAMPWFEHAIGKDGSVGDPRSYLGNALLALGRPDEALAQYEAALADHPVNPTYRATAAALLIERGKPARAAELYRDDTREWPRDPEGWFRLGNASARAGRPDAAREALAEAFRRTKGDHAAINGFGGRLLMSGQPELAADAFREAIRLQPDYGPAHMKLGFALETLSRPTEAAAEYEKALRVQPGFRDAADALERLRTAAVTRPRSSATQTSTTRRATSTPASGAFSSVPSTMPAR